MRHLRSSTTTRRRVGARTFGGGDGGWKGKIYLKDWRPVRRWELAIVLPCPHTVELFPSPDVRRSMTYQKCTVLGPIGLRHNRWNAFRLLGGSTVVSAVVMRRRIGWRKRDWRRVREVSWKARNGDFGAMLAMRLATSRGVDRRTKEKQRWCGYTTVKQLSLPMPVPTVEVEAVDFRHRRAA